jgi:K+-transporting ATPase A subunit
MTVLGWAQILLYCAIVVAITPVLGDYMTRVFSGERTFLSPILRPVEVAIYKMAGVNEHGSSMRSPTQLACCCSTPVGCCSFMC